MDVDAVATEVAVAVGLAEGPAGVADVLRVVARHEPVASSEIARRTELPVPIVVAICNELRKRGVVDRARPVRLTAAGRVAMAPLTGADPAFTGAGQLTEAGTPLAGTSVPLAGTSAPSSGASAPSSGAGTPLTGAGTPSAGASALLPGTSTPPAGASAPVAGARGPEVAGQCPCCQGRGVAVPEALAALLPALERAAAEMPAAKLDLDQTHCTPGTKLLRVLRMHDAGALAGQRVLVLGDDDLVSVAVAVAAAELGPAFRPRRLAVVDCDPDLLSYLAGTLGGLGLPAELVDHDVREPLPAPLAGAFDVVTTDPPYTVAGAELFLSRAVTALASGGAGHVFFSFGARRPTETLAVQRLLADMGLTVRSLTPGFNRYTGAGILGGTSHLYQLRATVGSQPTITGSYPGPLYSATSRAAATRPYRCVRCGAVHPVGPGARWPAIAALKQAGCPNCGGTVLRPQPLERR